MIRLENITLGYGSRVLLEGASATLEKGVFCALLGRNGTGKSTLLRTIAGLARPMGGEVFLAGRPVSTLHARDIAPLVSFVSTEPVRVVNLKVADVVALGRAPYTNWIGRLTPVDRDLVAHAMRLVGLAEFADKPLDTLSDGERQRVMIARALAQDTPIILLDEPTAFLDLPTRHEIFALLRTLAHDQNKAILCSTHDLDIARGMCDTLFLLHAGRLTGGTVSDAGPQVEYFLSSRACR